MADQATALSFPRSPFIVIPTYNENENISRLISEILSLDGRYQIIVIDDDSPDGTHETVRQMGHANQRIHLVHRLGERGRGSAGVVGFQRALECGADAIVEMDADFSHQPRYIPLLLEHLNTCDVVIGSRMVQGGTEKGRPVSRRMITKMASFFIRTWLHLPVRDPTSGFRAFRAETLAKIPLDRMLSVGPSIVEEILFYCSQSHFRLKEVPIVFEERHAGTSTLNSRLLLKTFLFVLLLPVRARLSGKA